MRRSILFVALILTTIPFLPAQEKKAGGRRYALLIGVQKYESSDLHDLECSDKDVADLAEVLRTNGYKSRDVTVLSTKEGARAPTGPTIRAALEAFLERDYSSEDMVLIAFSGHGIQLGKKFYFCPAGARLPEKDEKPEGLISMDELYRQLEKCKAGYRLLLTDCCRNNPFRAVSRIREVGKDLDLGEGMPRNVTMITSCAPGQKAYEDRDAFGRGVFFHFVIEGIKGKADLNEDGKVTRAELEAYLRVQMGKHRSKQTPETITRSRLDPPLAILEDGPIPGVLAPVRRIARERPHVWDAWAAISANGKAAITLDSFVLQAFDLEKGRRIARVRSSAGHKSGVALTARGLAMVGDSNVVYFVDPLTGTVVRKIPVRFIAGRFGLSRDEKRFFAAGGPNANKCGPYLAVFDSRGILLDTFDLGSEALSVGALVGSGEKLIAGTDSGKLFVYDVDAGRQLFELEGHRKSIRGIHVSRDGERATTICHGGTLIRWDLATGKKIDACDVRVGADVPWTVAFQSNGRRAIMGYQRGSVAIVDIPGKGKPRIRATYDKHRANVYVAITGDGSRAVSVALTDLWVYEEPAE